MKFKTITKKIANILFIILGALIINLFILKFFPGSPFQDEYAMDPLLKKIYSEKTITTYFLQDYLFNLFSVKSFSYPDLDAIYIVTLSFKKSLFISISSIIISILLGSVFYVISSMNDRLNKFIHQLSSFILSIPILMFAPMILFLKFEIESLYSLNSYILSYVSILFILTIRPIFYILNVLMSELRTSDVWALQFKALGVSEYLIYSKYYLKILFIQIIPFLGQNIISTLTGSFFVEYLFSVQGLGFLLVNSLQNRDIPVLLHLVLLFSFIAALITFINDWILIILDKRIKSS